MGLLISCLRHADLGEVSRTHGNIWVRKQGHKQIRCDKEAKELLRREWLHTVAEVTDIGREITKARPTEAGLEAVAAHLAARNQVVEVSTVDAS